MNLAPLATGVLGPGPLLGPGQVAGTGTALRVEHGTPKDIEGLMAPGFHAYLMHFKVHSLLIVPMRTEGSTIGTITLAKGGSSKGYSLEDQATLQSLADRAALTIVNAKLYAKNLEQADALKQANVELEKRVEERTAELERVNAKLQEMAMQDGLTALANRRHFDVTLDAEVRRARRTGGCLSLHLGVVDCFKKYNDRYGHVAGDACLQMIAQVMRDVFRRSDDLPARYGGEEFAVILPSSSPEQAAFAAEMFRKAVEAQGAPHLDNEASDVVTISIGYSSALVTQETTPDWFINRADEGLYISKANGRNRVTAAE